jgi:hypothetical protein
MPRSVVSSLAGVHVAVEASGIEGGEGSRRAEHAPEVRQVRLVHFQRPRCPAALLLLRNEVGVDVGERGLVRGAIGRIGNTPLDFARFKLSGLFVRAMRGVPAAPELVPPDFAASVEPWHGSTVCFARHSSKSERETRTVFLRRTCGISRITS